MKKTPMSIKEFIDPIIQRLHESANVKTVYGEPLSLEKKTIIPVARAGYGFGGRPGPENGEQSEQAGEFSNSAGGGSLASPIGVLEVTEDDTRFIPINDHHPLKLFGAFAAGMLLGAVLIARSRRRRPELEED